MDYENSKLLSCIAEVHEKLNSLKVRHSLFDGELLFAYRGESRNFGETKLMPSLFRSIGDVEKEAHLFELFLDYNMIDSHISTTNIEKAIETQHNVAISRMLDISFSVLAAIYFACGNADDSGNPEDGFVYVFVFPEHYSPHSSYIEQFYSRILEKKHPAYGKNFKVFTHSHLNDRIKAQSGGFIFFPGKTFTPISEVYYEKVVIPKEAKKEVLLDMEQLFHIKDSTFFPEKERIAAEVKRKFKNGVYSEREVSLEDEVDSLCSRVKYELQLLANDTAIPIERKLRKERSDLLQYINQNCVESETRTAQEALELREKLTRKTDIEFNLMKIEFRRS